MSDEITKRTKMSLTHSKSSTATAPPKPSVKIKKSSKLGRVQSETVPGAKVSKQIGEGTVGTPNFKSLISSQPNTEPPSPPNKAKSSDLGGDVPSDGNKTNDNSSSYAFTLLDVPSGFLPPAFKDCLLSNVVRSGRRSLDHLKEVRESLSNLVAEDEQLSKGIKKINPSPDILQLSLVAEALTVLTREAFVPTHRLNQTAIALYSTEDFLRYPKDIRAFDTIASGRIKVPDPSFNVETVQKLRNVVDKATEYYNKFNLKGRKGAELQDIMFTLMRAFQDLYTLMLGCQEVFKVLLYSSSREKLNLQQFLLSLQSMERSDMLTEVQDLRRLIDELVIFLEKLSWGCFVVYRLASGKTVAPVKTAIEVVGADLTAGQSKLDEVQLQHDVYPDFPLLQQQSGTRKIKPKGLGWARKKDDDKEKKQEKETAEFGKALKLSVKKSNLIKVKDADSSDASLNAMKESKPKKPKSKQVKFANKLGKKVVEQSTL